MDMVLLQRALVEHAAEVPDCWDLSQTHIAIAYGVQMDDSVPLINHDNVIIWKGIVFKTMEAIKTSLCSDMSSIIIAFSVIH
jgi:hypothetical protein